MGGPTGHVLHHKDDLILGLDRLVELRNMWVVQSFHEFDLTAHRLLALDLLHLLLQVYFEGHFLVGLLMHADVHYGVGSLSYLLAHDVVV